MIRKHFLKIVFQNHISNMNTRICILNQICMHNFYAIFLWMILTVKILVH